MIEYFTIPDGKVPTKQNVLDALTRAYDRLHTKEPTRYPKHGPVRKDWCDFNYQTFLTAMRQRVGEPLDTVPYVPWEEDCGDTMPIEEWLEAVEMGLFIDYDGFCHPAKMEYMEYKDGLNPRIYPCYALHYDPDVTISPSRKHLMPKDANHVIWYNR